MAFILRLTMRLIWTLLILNGFAQVYLVFFTKEIISAFGVWLKVLSLISLIVTFTYIETHQPGRNTTLLALITGTPTLDGVKYELSTVKPCEVAVKLPR